MPGVVKRVSMPKTKQMTTDLAGGDDTPSRPLSLQERGVVVGTLLLIATLVAFDVGTDLVQGASAWHVALEIAAGIAAVAGAAYLLRDTLRLRRRLATQAATCPPTASRLRRGRRRRACRWKGWRVPSTASWTSGSCRSPRRKSPSCC